MRHLNYNIIKTVSIPYGNILKRKKRKAMNTINNKSERKMINDPGWKVGTMWLITPNSLLLYMGKHFPTFKIYEWAYEMDKHTNPD